MEVIMPMPMGMPMFSPFGGGGGGGGGVLGFLGGKFGVWEQILWSFKDLLENLKRDLQK